MQWTPKHVQISLFCVVELKNPILLLSELLNSSRSNQIQLFNELVKCYANLSYLQATGRLGFESWAQSGWEKLHPRQGSSPFPWRLRMVTMMSTL